MNRLTPSEKEDRAPVSLSVVLKREFQQISLVCMENLVKFPLHHNIYSRRSSTRVTRLKRGQGTCSFKCCDEEGISPGCPYIQMRPAEIPFSVQLLKMQEPCPPSQMVSLPYGDRVFIFKIHSNPFLSSCLSSFWSFTHLALQGIAGLLWISIFAPY